MEVVSTTQVKTWFEQLPEFFFLTSVEISKAVLFIYVANESIEKLTFQFWKTTLVRWNVETEALAVVLVCHQVPLGWNKSAASEMIKMH